MIAFTLVCVMEKCGTGRIECMEPWGESNLLIGTADGAVLLINVRAVDPAASAAVAPGAAVSATPMYVGTCVDSVKTANKRAVVQLGAVEELEILVLLTAEGGPIAVHDLTRGLPQRAGSPLAKTKGCTLFTLGRNNSSGALTLCAALKRKLALYSWDGAQFVEVRELNIADGARTIAWADTALLVGSRREYSLVNAQTGEVSPLFPTGKTAASTSYAVRVPDDGLLVSRDNVSVFLNLDGGAAREHGVSWTEAPSQFVVASPYIIALLPKLIEVRMVAASAQNFAQMLPGVKNGKCLAAKKLSGTNNYVIYVATQTSIYRLVPAPLAAQVDELVADREFDAALALCEAMGPPNDPARIAKTRSVRVSCAYSLYAQGQYRRSLELFAELRVDPLEVIGLYPGLLPAALRRTIRKPPVETLELAGPGRENALRALVAFLVQLRPLVCTPDAVARSLAGAAQEADGDYSACTTPATVVDSTLLRVCVAVGDDKRISDVCGSPNTCHVKDATDALLAANRHADLVQFYRSKGLHAKALELLAAQSGPLSEPVHTIKYLRRLGARHKDLVFAYAQRVLRQSPELALTIFTEGDREPEEELPHADVLAFLKAKAANSTVPYLEFIIQRRGETSPEFHDELAFQYLEKIKRFREAGVAASPSLASQPVPAGSEPGMLGKTRAALLRFLETSEHYHPEALLTGERIPVGALF